LNAQVAGVQPCRRHRHVRLRGKALLVAERAQSCLLTRRVRVECKDHLPGGRVVTHHASDRRNVLGPERRATGGYRGRHPGEVACHHIGVALDDHDRALPCDVPLGKVESVQHLTLPVDRSLGRVEVFRTGVVAVETSRAEAHRLPRDIADGPDHTTPETVVDTSATFRDEPCRLQFSGRESAALEALSQTAPPSWGESDAEVRCGAGVETPLPEELTRCFRVGFGKLRTKELRGGGVRLVQPDPAGAFPLITVRGMECVSHTCREPFDGLAEGELIHLLHERVCVARLAASETVVEAGLGPDMETGSAFVVKRTQALQ